MKNMKRIISALLFVAMLLSLGVTAMAAKADATISIEDVFAARNDTVTVNVNISENSGFAGLMLDVEYDNGVLSPVFSADAKECITLGESFKTCFLEAYDHKGDESKSTLRFAVAGDSDTTANGTLCSISFNVLTAAPIGKSDLKLCVSPKSFCNDKGRELTANVVDGSVTVSQYSVSTGGTVVYDGALPTARFDLTTTSKSGSVMIMAAYGEGGKLLLTSVKQSGGTTCTFSGIDNTKGEIETLSVFTLGTAYVPTAPAITIYPVK